MANLERTKGVIPEFVNPKYADEARNRFKAPTRLECMMQEYPKLLTAKGVVGFTTYDTWYSFSPVKNNIKDAAVLSAKNMPSFGGAQGEYDFYHWSNKILASIGGVNIIEEKEAHDYQGIKLAFGPKILIDPTFAITLQEIRDKFKGNNHITKDSTLILKGFSTRVENLNLDGYLKAESGVISGEVLNKEKVELAPSKETDDEIYRIRGFKPVHIK